MMERNADMWELTKQYEGADVHLLNLMKSAGESQGKNLTSPMKFRED